LADHLTEFWDLVKTRIQQGVATNDEKAIWAIYLILLGRVVPDEFERCLRSLVLRWRRSG
jgi:hypothetical protein